ncbi:MAG: hypothetical protein LBJ67_15640 [Planctomycetaceae bacterium]|jgi:hypothetical protein|nr:hypothetical protein [Planctomycetaceae bacterium]
MNEQPQENFNQLECRCPVCGAEQAWQNECRRCRTDIRILRQLANEAYSLQRRCFEALMADDHARAKKAAEQLAQIHPTQFYEKLSRFLKE